MIPSTPCRLCASPAEEETDRFVCGGCYMKAVLLIRKLISVRKTLRRKVRVLKDISGMLQHGERIAGATLPYKRRAGLR